MKKAYKYFVYLGLISLFLGTIIGNLALLSYLLPETFKNILPFYVLRPFHVSSVVGWIFLGIIGIVYYSLPGITLNAFSSLNYKLMRVQIILFIVGGTLILGSYIFKKFGGREYWAFPPVFAGIIILSWLIFIYNFVSNVKGGTFYQCKRLLGFPVHLWMWGTGLFFFLFTFLEVYAWLIPYFKERVIIDLTTQWKAYGSLVGSWNMFIYGTALFVMASIHNKLEITCKKITYFFYLLGLTNLMLGWAHHVYPVPNAKWIRLLAYAISMTELLVLAKLIWDWKSQLPKLIKTKYSPQYKFLLYTDLWIFLNLLLAIAMSIPAINVYTHGTHITVAHAMGTTIGINSSILIATILFMFEDYFKQEDKKLLNIAFYLFQAGLIVFWIGLILAGITKGYHRTVLGESFYEYRETVNKYMWLVYWASYSVLVAFTIILLVIGKRFKEA